MKEANTPDPASFSYQSLVENLRSGVIICRPVKDGKDFILIDFNKTAKGLNKTIKEELVGKNFRDVFPIIAENGLLKLLSEVHMTGKSMRLPVTTYKDQRIAEWIEYFALKMDSGEVVVIFDDLTEIKITEEKLIKSEERLNLSLDIMDVGLLDWHIPSGKIYFSDVFYTMAGYTPGELEASYQTWQDLLHPDDRKHTVRQVERVLMNPDTHLEAEFRFRRKDSSYMWVLYRGRVVEQNEKGNPLRMLGTHTNISFLKEAAEKEHQMALEAVERQKTLFEISRLYNTDFNKIWQIITEKASETLLADRVGIWKLTEENSKLICEDVFTRSSATHDSGSELFYDGYPAYFRALETSRYIDSSNGLTDPRTKELTDIYLVPLNIRSLLDVPVRKRGALSGVLCFEYTGRIRHWSPEKKEFAASLADLVSGKFEALERELAQIELNEARKQAEESDRLKTSLLANMSHELRTPMNSILGFSELMLNDSDDPEVAFYTKKIHGAGKRLMNTLQAILELADLETTRSRLTLSDVDLMKILVQLLSPFQNMAYEKGLYFVTEFDNRINVKADENLLKLVFRNLMDNAVKFTESGGISVETAFTNKEGLDWALVQIKDTGIGIAAEDLDRIFQEFRQVSEGYNRRYEGTGLGLTLSSKMIRMMGGDITVESELGLGSIFTVWLPLVSVVSGKSETTTISTEEKKQNPSVKVYRPPVLPLVLVVEDNEDNAEIVKLYLKSHYRIDRAPEGITALKMAEQKKYNAILMDINLGTGMDGLRIIKELRSRNDYLNTPIIAITGYTMTSDKEKIMEAGCTHYLAKPFTKSRLVSTMSEALASIPK